MKKVLFSFAILSVSVGLSAQTAMPDFSKLGYKKSVMYTSSKGEFEEFHDQTDVVEIGTVLFNTKTNQIVGFVSEEKAETDVASATAAMSVDPNCEKYYWISPYAYCLNNPIRLVDTDGRTPKIYVETNGVGHTFVTTGEGKSTTVYTYGRYGGLDKDKSIGRSLSRTGEGVLVIMKGNEALKYIEHEVKDMGASIYEIKNGSDEKIDAHFNDMFESSDQKPSTGKYQNADNAKVVDTYDLFDNNCTTKSVEAVKVSTDGKLDLKSKGPANVDTKLYYENQKEDSQIKEIYIKDIYDEYKKNNK